MILRSPGRCGTQTQFGLHVWQHPKICSQELLSNLLRHQYTRIEFVQEEIGASRPTATKYLDELAGSGMLFKDREGRNNYDITQPLVALFVDRETEVE